MNKEVIEKIKKLMALSDSKNENEAKTALLMARKLMAKHKIEESDIQLKENNVVTNYLDDVKFTTKRKKWVAILSNIIANNHACTAVVEMSNTHSGKVKIIGLRDDVDMCTAIVRYAIDFVDSEMKRIIKKRKGYGFSTKEASDCAEQYANGFMFGLDQLYQEQNSKNQEWGLVMVTPKEVKDAVKDMGCKNKKHEITNNKKDDSFNKGYRDGRNFTTEDKLQAGA